MNRLFLFRTPSKQGSILLATTFLACLMVMPLKADIVSELGSAGPEFWAIVTNDNNPHLNGPGTTNGNVAVTQPGAVLSLDSSNPFAINGNVSLAPGATISHPAQVNGQIFSNQNLTGVLADATAAAAFFAAQSVTSGITSITSTQTINPTGATTVLDVNNFNLGSNILTLNGTASDNFIINITAGGLKLNSGKINLTGGLLESDVVFNIESGDLSTSGGLGNESVIDGIVLAGASSSIHMSPGLINGELISLTSTGAFQIVSGGSVNMPPPPPIPEPSTYYISGLGLVLLAGIAWRRRSAAGERS